MKSHTTAAAVARERPVQSTIEGGVFSGLFQSYSRSSALAESGVPTEIFATRNFVLSRSRISGLRLSRMTNGFDRDGLDLFAIMLQRHESPMPCDIVRVHDLSQPFDIDALTESGVQELIVLWVPRSRILRGFSNELALHGLSLPCALPAADIVAAALERFSRRADAMSLDEFDAAAAGLIELAASAINQRLKAKLGPALGAPLASFLSIRRHIDQNITARGLNAETLSAAFGLSRATLYRLFEPVGGVGQYIRTARLTRAYREITAPQNANRRTGDIAMRLGFPSASAFIRLFRETYGLSPTQARKRAFERVGDEHPVIQSTGQAGLSRYLSQLQK